MYIEADMLYAYLKTSDWLKKHAETILKKFKVVTSIITIIEIEFVAKRDFGNEFANSILEKPEKIENLEFTNLQAEILKNAVEFRKKFNLNIFDAIHAATANYLKKDIISTDRIFDIIPEIKRIDPREIKL